MSDVEASAADMEAVIGQPLSGRDRETLAGLSEHLKSLIGQTNEQTSSMGKWLLATLVAVNGGAIISSMRAIEDPASIERAAGALWLAGLMTALMSGFASMLGGMRGAMLLTDMVSTITIGLHADKFPDIRFNDKVAKILRWQRWTLRLGAISCLAFLSGAVVFAISWYR